MKACILMLFSLLIALLVVAVPVFSDDNANRLEDPAFETQHRPGSLFDHDIHMEMNDGDCSACHHVYENGQKSADETSEGEACSDCHQLKDTPENRVDLLSAYHHLCKECHVEQKQGPIACGECHRR